MTEISNVQLNTSNINVTSSSQTTNAVSNDALPMVKKLTAEEICQKLGITKDQLNEILTKNPTLNPEALTVSDVEKYLNPKEVPTIEQPVQTEEQSVVKTSDFDRKNFKDASPQEKYETLAYEAAKSNYLYGDNNNIKTAEQWDALAPEEQQKLVEQTKNTLNKVAEKYLGGTDIDITNSSELVDRLMTELQTADANGFDLESYAKLDKVERDSFKYDYLSEIEDTSTLTRSEKEFLDKINFSKNALECHLKNEAAKKGKDVSNFNICIEDIANTYKESGSIVIDAQYEYLTEKVEKGETLTAFEKEQYEGLKNIVNDPIYQAADKKNVKVNEDNAINALKNSEKYSEIYTNADAASQKDMIHQALLKECKDDKELYAKKLKECTEYAIADGDYKLAQELSVLMNKEGVTISEDDSAASIVLATQNISEGSSETAVKNDEIADKFKNKKLAKAVQIGNRNHAGEHQMVDLSARKVDDIDVQKANVDMRNRAENTEVICKVDDNIKANSSVEARKYAIETIGTLKQNKEAQSYCYENQLSDGVPELVEAGANVISELHKDIQVKEFKFTKSIAQDLPNAKDIEMALADQIQNCDKDNQLELHNEIMTSKYSEVQEHAASNIKNYDPSVQSAAIDTVYASGNQKAINNAVNAMNSYKSDDVKSQELARVFGEATLQNAKSEDFQEKFLSGSLSIREIAQLTASERREYFIELFKKASPEQKIKWLSKMSGGVQQKTVFTFIALYDHNLLGRMVENGMGLEMFNVCNDVKAQNKIFAVMERSENDTVKKQCALIKNDPRNAGLFIGKDVSKEKEAKTAGTSQSNYNTVPEGFGLFKRQDKFGRTYLNA